AKVSYQKNQLEILKSLDMKGQITFHPKEPIKLHLEGNVSTGNRHSLLTIDGSGHFNVLKADVEVRMKNHFKDEARIRCMIDPSQEREHK
ncbi:hypothetical protein M3M44_09145, partial [Lactobacillus johnsonii]|uniref:hypothetical protein n=1 Tax=Lactobacillus johnsonii TaxID=33959 RepID=UPI00201A6E87